MLRNLVFEIHTYLDKGTIHQPLSITQPCNIMIDISSYLRPARREIIKKDMDAKDGANFCLFYDCLIYASSLAWTCKRR